MAELRTAWEALGRTGVATERRPPISDAERKRRARHQYLLKTYGLTLKRYEELRSAQGDCCAICASPETGSVSDWHVDHDHATGVVRGLLCHGCNVGLGNFADDPARLHAAAEYLEGANVTLIA